MGHVHAHAPHELTEGTDDPRDRQGVRNADPSWGGAPGRAHDARDGMVRLHAAVPLREPRAQRELDAASDELYEDGTKAKGYEDRDILSTIFIATVPFFVGISLRLDRRPLRIAVLGMAFGCS